MQNPIPWHEEDSFWQAVGPILFSDRRWADAPMEVADLISLLGIEPGARVLDLCCGEGRHSLELARRGFHVAGVDRMSTYLERARERAQEEGLQVEFVKDDMRTFCRPDAFDAVVNVFTSFGYFEDPDDDRQVVMNAYRSLRSGGSFLLDTMGKEVLARVFRERDWQGEDGITVLRETKVAGNWSRSENRWVILKDGARREVELSLRLYSAVEISSLLNGCGFAAVDIYGDLKGGPYDHTAKRLIVVAKK